MTAKTQLHVVFFAGFAPFAFIVKAGPLVITSTGSAPARRESVDEGLHEAIDLAGAGIVLGTGAAVRVVNLFAGSGIVAEELRTNLQSQTSSGPQRLVVEREHQIRVDRRQKLPRAMRAQVQAEGFAHRRARQRRRTIAFDRGDACRYDLDVM